MAKLILALAQLHYASHLYNSSEARLWSLIHTDKAKSLSYLLLCDKGYTKQTTQGLVQESKEQVTWFLYQRCREAMHLKNQSRRASTREILGKEMTQDFLPRFTCFLASYSSLWRCTHLMDHELINYQELNPQQVPHIHSQDGDPPSHVLH
jgi:hypothetical protein